MRFGVVGALLATCCAALCGAARAGCGEATSPAPWEKDGADYYLGVHDELVKECYAANTGLDIVFYGDSMTEQWRGTKWLKPWYMADGVPAVFAKHFGQYKTLILGMGGDQVANTWWRIQNGEFPAVPPKLAVVWLGTNDLSTIDAGCGYSQAALSADAPGVVTRLRSVVDLLHSLGPSMKVLLLGVLPRGTDFWDMGPGMYEWPNRYSPAIDIINGLMQDMTKELPFVNYVYCGAPFNMSGGGLDANMVPDGQHLNAAGMELLAECMQPHVDALVKGQSATVSAGPAPAPAAAPMTAPAPAPAAPALFSAAPGPAPQPAAAQATVHAPAPSAPRTARPPIRRGRPAPALTTAAGALAPAPAPASAVAATTRVVSAGGGLGSTGGRRLQH